MNATGAKAAKRRAGGRRPSTSSKAYQTRADLGGRSGYGPVQPEPEGELWHAAWEPRAMALTVALGSCGEWNIDMSRAARETLPLYRSLTYYEIWIGGLCRLLAERGLVGEDELQAGRALREAPPPKRVVKAAELPAVLAKGSPTAREADTPARFAVGQRVRTYGGVVPHHTRLPAYARGRVGTIERVHGAHVFADANALGIGEQPQWLYTVAFDGSELWSDAQPGLVVSIDAWEPYLQAA